MKTLLDFRTFSGLRLFNCNIRSLLYCSSTPLFILFVLEGLRCCGTASLKGFIGTPGPALLRARNEDNFHPDNAPGECSTDFRNLVANATPPSHNAFATSWHRCWAYDSDLSRCSGTPCDWQHQYESRYLFARPNRSPVSDSWSF